MCVLGTQSWSLRGRLLSWKAKPQPCHHEEWPSGYGKKPNLVTSYSVATMYREGALHLIENHMKGHLVIVVTAGYSGLAARCCRVFLEPSSLVSSMLPW